MSTNLGPQPLNATRSYHLILSGSGLNASLLGHFDGTEVFTVKLWPGGSYEPLPVTLTAEWATTNAAGVALANNPAGLDRPDLLLTIPADEIAAIDPGTYQLQIIADAGTVDEPVYSGSIEFTPAPGLIATPRTYCTYRDMLDEAPWIGQFNVTDGARPGGFLQERARASRDMERVAIARRQRDINSQSRAHSPLSAVDAVEWTSGYDAGPAYGASSYIDTTADAEMVAFTDALADHGLEQDYPADAGGLRQATTFAALAYVLDDQIGRGNAGGEGAPYIALSASYARRSRSTLMGVELRMRLEAEGSVIFRLVH